MTKTIEIKTIDGEEIDVEVEELTAFEKFNWVAAAPSEMLMGVDEFRLTNDVMDFLTDLTLERTEVTMEILNKLDEDELARLFNGVSAYSFGIDVDLSREGEPDPTDQDIELNEDGSVDLEDWR